VMAGGALLAGKSRKWGMYTCGATYERRDDLVFNAAPLFDRTGTCVVSFCRETRSSHVRPLPNGRGSDKKSRCVNETIRAATVRERCLLAERQFRDRN
jgi:hypothetical protein